MKSTSWKENNVLREGVVDKIKHNSRENKYYNRLCKLSDLLNECIDGDFIPVEKKGDFEDFLALVDSMLKEGFEPVKNPFFPNGFPEK